MLGRALDKKSLVVGGQVHHTADERLICGEQVRDLYNWWRQPPGEKLPGSAPVTEWLDHPVVNEREFIDIMNPKKTYFPCRTSKDKSGLFIFYNVCFVQTVLLLN